MLNRILLPLLFVFVFAAALPIGCSKFVLGRSQYGNTSIQGLERRLEEIDKELASLAEYNLRSGVGSVGFRSRPHLTPDNFEWIQIDFDSEYAIDELVLVPTILRDTDTGLKDDAFPVEFKVVVGSGDHRAVDGLMRGTEIASFDASDALLPRVAPLILDCQGIKSSWIRIEATKLGARRFDGKYLLQFSEILAFSGSENVALAQPVSTSSNLSVTSPGWGRQFAVDGFVPFLMNSSTGGETLAFASEVGIGNKPIFGIALEQEYTINEVRIHLVGQGDTVPQSFAGDFGFPGRLVIEGALKEDFSDAQVLLDYKHSDAYDIGPILARRVSPTTSRFIRVTAMDPYLYLGEGNSGTRLGLAELELLSGEQNVAYGKKVTADFGCSDAERTLQAITDGKNRYGEILPTRQWMLQLARRHDLEKERPRAADELNRLYQKQRTWLKWLIGLAGLLALGAVIAVLVGWILRNRAVQRTRERIAADLHDELGANFHAIGLLSDLIQKSSDSPEQLKPLLGRIRELTERTGLATTQCVNMLDSVGLYGDLEQDMRRASQRITADLQNEFVFQGEQNLAQLSPRKRIDLFLFYKESLTNVIRHSAATKVTTRLKATPEILCLEVIDNGHGFQESFANGIPPSLGRRAKLLGAEAKAVSVKTGGTKLELKLRLKPGWPLSLFAKDQPNSNQSEAY